MFVFKHCTPACTANRFTASYQHWRVNCLCSSEKQNHSQVKRGANVTGLRCYECLRRVKVPILLTGNQHLPRVVAAVPRRADAGRGELRGRRLGVAIRELGGMPGVRPPAQLIPPEKEHRQLRDFTQRTTLCQDGSERPKEVTAVSA